MNHISQEYRIRRIMFRLRDGWAIDPAGRDGLSGVCFPFYCSDNRKSFAVSKADIGEMLRRELIAPPDERLTGFVLGPSSDLYLRVVKGGRTT